MSTWVFVAALGGMATVGVAGLVALTPKRHPGRHIPNPAPAREEAGADATYAAELQVMAAEIAEDRPMPEPHYTRTGEFPLVDRPAGDTFEWEIQERVADQPDLEPWTLAALADEPTPLFETVTALPVFEELESFTKGWNRAELLREMRRAELEMAKANPEPADEELAA